MRLCVCGGRYFTDLDYEIPRLQRVHLATPVTTLICGMAKGADSIAHAWATELGISIEEYYPDWTAYGRAAGPIRNQRMADEGHPDLVIGMPGGNGTASMLGIARKAGIKVIEYRYNYFVLSNPVWGFLSNFYPVEITDENGHVYQSTEHLYQAEKTLDPAQRQAIIDAPTPGKAKRLGGAKTLSIRPDWDTYRFVAMRKALRLKFPATGGEMTDRLLSTGEDYLVEKAAWDAFWGSGPDNKGLNWLGRLLMQRRDKIIEGRNHGNSCA